MRIAFDAQIFGWQAYGGISRYFFELATGLAERPDCEVAIVAPLYVNRHLKPGSGRLAVHGRRVPSVPRTGRVLRALNNIMSGRAMTKLRPHILHETYYTTTRRRPPGCKVVLTVFDMIHERFPGYFSALDPTRREKQAAVANADHVICISENTRRDLVELLSVPPEKTSVVYLGFKQHAGVGRRTSAARPFLLHVGLRGGYKNFETLLKAYSVSKLLRDHCDVIAFGGGGFTRRENDLMRGLGLGGDRVRQISGDDGVLADLYGQATAFVYPSLYEGFGIPPLEAMNHDCPVVCGKTSSLPEVVGDAAEFCDPRSADDMRRAIEKVVTDSALRVALVRQGRARIQRFSWERCCEETLAIYRRVQA